jgi:hypothetical protein
LDYHVFDPEPERHFVFSVEKTREEMAVELHSSDLFFSIYRRLENLDILSSGLALLKNLPDLE